MAGNEVGRPGGLTMTYATVENMRKAKGRVVAYSPMTGETFSAAPEDYFWLSDKESLLDSVGEPLMLAERWPWANVYVDVLTHEIL
jgi:hypothetical protein